MTTLPIIMSKSGAVPRPVAVVRQAFIDRVTAENPGYTANLPGSLIEDIASTDTAAIAMSEQAFVELINSITPYGANDFLLAEIGAMQGLKPSGPTNATVFEIFSGTPGYVIDAGFTVSNGISEYVAVEPGIIKASGTSDPVLCQATQKVDTVPAANTINVILTGVDPKYTVTCNNPLPGIPATGAQTSDDFRAQVLAAFKSSAVGMPTFVKTQVARVPNVPTRGVGVKQVPGQGWQVLVIGGDQYDVALAIFKSISDVSRLIGSQIDGSRTAFVTLYDDPDEYLIPYVKAPGQSVAVELTWATALPNFYGRDAVAAASRQPIADYVNSIPVGQPINILEIERVFQDSIASLIPSKNIISISVQISINGIPFFPTVGTSIVPGDPEGFFATTAAAVTVGS